MTSTQKLSLGLDFGTESVRALFVNMVGKECGSAAVAYPHGQITRHLPSLSSEDPIELPPGFALQHPQDWLDCAAEAVHQAMQNGRIVGDDVIGMGVDFTSCTVLPVAADSTPLCLVDTFAQDPMAWPKLWKHHGAGRQAEQILAIALQRNESFLPRYGNCVSLEWLFPKILETLEVSPAVYRATELFMEAGDWLVWKLIGGSLNNIPRSTCQAGYKAFWSAQQGWPSEAFFAAIHPELTDVVSTRLRGVLCAPGTAAGELSVSMAKLFGLRPGIPVSSAIIDAHAGVPGAGAACPGTMVMVMGTSSCQLVNATTERHIPGVAGVVCDGILPGYFGYETGQAAVGDAFDWLRRLTGQAKLDTLGHEAIRLPPGAEGVSCVDWFNGCRTPLMNENLRGSFMGLNLQHTPAHLYRALLEATAMGVRWIIEDLRQGGVPVEQVIATGGLPHHNPGIMQIYADVLGTPVTVHPSRFGPALGSAILGALAAQEFSSPQAAIEAMAVPEEGAACVYTPNPAHQKSYDVFYSRYRQACAAAQLMEIKPDASL